MARIVNIRLIRLIQTFPNHFRILIIRNERTSEIPSQIMLYGNCLNDNAQSQHTFSNIAGLNSVPPFFSNSNLLFLVMLWLLCYYSEALLTKSQKYAAM